MPSIPFLVGAVIAVAGLFASLDPKYLEVFAVLTVAAAGVGLGYRQRTRFVDALLVLAVAAAVAGCIMMRSVRGQLLVFGLDSQVTALATPIILSMIAPLGASMMVLAASRRLAEVGLKRAFLVATVLSLAAFVITLFAALLAGVGIEATQSAYNPSFLLEQSRESVGTSVFLRTAIATLAAVMVVSVGILINHRQVAHRARPLLFAPGAVGIVYAVHQVM